MIVIDGVRQDVMVWIPARGGSKGLPRKALLPLGDRPVIAHTIEYARACPLVDRVLVNTDDPEIADVSRQWGADAPFLRPAEMAQDHSSLQEAYDHMWDWLAREEGYRPGVRIGMSPTYPFRLPGRLETALHVARGNENIVGVCSMLPVDLPDNNLWTMEHGRPRPFPLLHPEGAELKPGGQRFLRLFSFNVTLECRYPLFASREYSRSWPLPLTALEGVDLDEPKDYALAQSLVQAEGRDRPAPAQTPRAGGCAILGKHFTQPEVAREERLLRHPDFPLLGLEEEAAFLAQARAAGRPAMSGCRIDSDSHPFRWVGEDVRGYTAFVVDVPDEIRGARQRYAPLHRFVPALLYVPAGFPLSGLARLDGVEMIVLERERLLDRCAPCEALTLRALAA